MFLRKKPVLLPAGTDLHAEINGDLEDAFADLTDACFAPPVFERSELVYESNRYRSPGALLRARLITRGQWLLLVVSGLDGELLNGGLAEFIVNNPDWIDDVPPALEELGLQAFRDSYVETMAHLETVIDGFNPSGGTSLLSMFRDMRRLEAELVKNTEDCLIDRNFTMRLDGSSRSLVWHEDQWTRQLKRRMIDWVADHPEEFREPS